MPFALRRKKQTRITDDQKQAWDQRDRQMNLQVTLSKEGQAAFDALPPEIRKAVAEAKWGYDKNLLRQLQSVVQYQGVHAAMTAFKNVEWQASQMMKAALDKDLEEMKAKLERSFNTHV